MTFDPVRATLRGLSEHQYKQRDKLGVAREYASAQIACDDIPNGARELYMTLCEFVSEWRYRDMTDEHLNKAVDVCRHLLHAARLAIEVVNGK